MGAFQCRSPQVTRLGPYRPHPKPPQCSSPGTTGQRCLYCPVPFFALMPDGQNMFLKRPFFALMPDGFVYFTPRLRLAFFVINGLPRVLAAKGGEERPEAAQAKAPPARGPPRTDIPDRTATRRARRRAKMGFWSRPASPPFHLAGPPFHFYGPPFHLSGPSFHPLRSAVSPTSVRRSTHLARHSTVPPTSVRRSAQFGPPFRPTRRAIHRPGVLFTRASTTKKRTPF